MSKNIRDNLINLLNIIEKQKKYDYGNMKWYYIAGSDELTKALEKCQELLGEENVRKVS